MDERKVRGNMSKSIPGGSGKDLDALIAQYNKELMSFYRKNASRILPTEEDKKARTSSETAAAQTAAQPVSPVMDFPVPVVSAPVPANAEPVMREEEQEVENMFTAENTVELPSRTLVPDASPMVPAQDSLPDQSEAMPEINEEEENYQDDEAETDTGYIQVRTFTARQAIPVPGAFITITRKDGDGEKVIRMMETDISGLSPVVPLPTVSRELSMQPGTDHPYTSYIIQSDAEGYYSVRNLNVPVYGGITAVQPVEMVPLPEQVPSGMLEFPESGPVELD